MHSVWDVVFDFKFVAEMAALIGVIVSLWRTKKDATEEEKDRAVRQSEGLIKANAKLDRLCTDSNETRIDLKSIQRTINKIMITQTEHDVRIEGVEKKCKDLSARLDAIEHN